jgi:predicted nucleic acid-binding protein
MFYLDTSFLVPYFVSEENSAQVEKFLRAVKGEELVVSAWTATEFISALGLKSG